MNWINKCKLPAIKIIKYNRNPCLELADLWQALHSSFNLAQFWEINEMVLNELKSFPLSAWLDFLEEEFICTIINCSNLFVPGPDKLLWRHLKHIIKDKACLKNIISITNACFKLGYWPNYFKKLMMIVILKFNKLFYDFLKFFRPIILLNTMDKLIKKVIRVRLQFHVILNNFIHQSQLGGLKFKSTSDIGIALTHFIHTGWIKNMLTSTLVFDITQFFIKLLPFSLNPWKSRVQVKSC